MVGRVVRLRVLINKRTGQGTVFLPKKKFRGVLPEFINLKIRSSRRRK